MARGQKRFPKPAAAPPEIEVAFRHLARLLAKRHRQEIALKTSVEAGSEKDIPMEDHVENHTDDGA
jgi:hypothetical protein